MAKPLDLSGEVYGRLVAVKRVGKNKSGNSLWECKCSCGITGVFNSGNLRLGTTKSCGCLQKELLAERNRLHGSAVRGKVSRTYEAYNRMKQRCTNQDNKSYSDYGGRGIKICKRWLKSFDNFLKDMGEKPEGLSLDRINNQKGYTKSNCRWATDEQQNNNRRNNRIVVLKGVQYTLTQACREFNVTKNAVYGRLNRGWSLEEAFNLKRRI